MSRSTPGMHTVRARASQEQGTTTEERRKRLARLVETLVLGSVAKSTQKKLFSEVERLGENEKNAW